MTIGRNCRAMSMKSISWAVMPVTNTPAGTPAKARGIASSRKPRTAAMPAYVDAPAVSGTDSNAKSFAALAVSVAGPKEPLVPSDSVRASIAPMTASDPMSPSITISAGAFSPKPNSSWSTSKPCLAWNLSGSSLTPEVPVLMLKKGIEAATRSPRRAPS